MGSGKSKAKPTIQPLTQTSSGQMPSSQPASIVPIKSDKPSGSKQPQVPNVQPLKSEPIQNEADVANMVKNSWKLIDQQCQNPSAIYKLSNVQEQPFPEVRIFVSSTFTDFHAEREILVKHVFPKLKDICSKHGISLIPTDLRWGVPKDTEASQTIRICLEELNNCYKLNEMKPFFINMIGDRYGWIPKDNEVPDDIRQTFAWIPNVSITHMEILHGAYRINNPRSIFFLRDPEFLKDLPKEFISKFIDDSQLAKSQLNELKRRLKIKFNDRCVPYQVKYEGTENSTGRPLVKLSGLDKGFADKAYEFLLKVITEAYINKRGKHLKMNQDDFLQRHYLMELNELFVGRSSELQILDDYFNQKTNVKRTKLDYDKAKLSHEELKTGVYRWIEAKKSNPIFFLSGDKGVGKSALLSKFLEVTTKKYPNIQTYGNFPGSPAKTSIAVLLQRLVDFASGKNPEVDNNEAYEQFQSNCQTWLNTSLPAMEQSGQKYLLVFDGLNQDPIASLTTWHLEWLSYSFPPNVFCVVSCTNGHAVTTSRLECRGAYKLDLKQLNKQEQKLFVEKSLAQYNKILDKDQMNTLLKSDRLPLWLSIAVEELRIFGDFRQLNTLISQFPTDLPSFIWQVIDRKIHEDDTNIIKKLLCVLWATKNHDGINEDELKMVLGNPETQQPIAHAVWITGKVMLGKMFIRINPFSTVSLAEDEIIQVVQDKLIPNRDDQVPYHKLQASHYSNQADLPKMLEHLPYQLAKSNQADKLVDFYYSSQRTARHTQGYERRNNLKMIKCQTVVTPTGGQPPDAYICNFCAPQFQTEAECFLCKLRIPGLHDAQLCRWHLKLFPFCQCITCGRQTATSTASKAKICQECCGFGQNVCCALLPAN